MRYLMLVCVNESLQMTPEEHAEHMRAVGSWVREMEDRGVRVLGDRLRPADDAVAIQVRDGELLMSEGPFAEAKEQMGGFDVIECADQDEAIEVASRHPGAQYGTIELRPFWPE